MVEQVERQRGEGSLEKESGDQSGMTSLVCSLVKWRWEEKYLTGQVGIK